MQYPFLCTFSDTTLRVASDETMLLLAGTIPYFSKWYDVDVTPLTYDKSWDKNFSSQDIFSLDISSSVTLMLYLSILCRHS